MQNYPMQKTTRLYEGMLSEHLESHRQMVFLSGPRQVGKTTLSKQLATHYLDWDHLSHRKLIMDGPDAVAAYCNLEELKEKLPVIVLDEIHRYSKWKTFLKGFYDSYSEQCKMIVTGSSRLDVFQKGGDSLMGRYFHYRMHPFSVGELLHSGCNLDLIRAPKKITREKWQSLWLHGGFPEPFIKSNDRFERKWRTLRQQQLFKEDIRDLTNIQEIGQMETLGQILAHRSGEQLININLANEIQVSPHTVKNWISILSSLHFGFRIKPWYKNITKSLRKEPKWFLRDWGNIEDPGKRAETMTACHLLKAVETWTDLGLGSFELRYIRDRNKREVDFLVTHDMNPWFLVEVKYKSEKIADNLQYFQTATNAPHAFQVVFEKDFVNADSFKRNTPTIIPAKTFLSQLP